MSLGTVELMRSKVGLTKSEECLHNFCRLLLSIKQFFTLVDLTKPDEYPVWLEALALFTKDVLNAGESVSTRTVQYLIKVWGSLVLPTPYLQVRDGYRTLNSESRLPRYLEGLVNYVPLIVNLFVSTRCDLCAAVV